MLLFSRKWLLQLRLKMKWVNTCHFKFKEYPNIDKRLLPSMISLGVVISHNWCPHYFLGPLHYFPGDLPPKGAPDWEKGLNPCRQSL